MRNAGVEAGVNYQVPPHLRSGMVPLSFMIRLDTYVHQFVHLSNGIIEVKRVDAPKPAGNSAKAESKEM